MTTDEHMRRAVMENWDDDADPPSPNCCGTTSPLNCTCKPRCACLCFDCETCGGVMDDDVREIGMVEDVHGNPLYLAVYRGQVNIAGFHLNEAKCEEFSQYFVRAQWVAARDRAGEDHG